MQTKTPTLIAVYSGNTLNSCEILAASADPQLVELVSRQLLTSRHRSTVRANRAEPQIKKTAEVSSQ